MNKNFDKALLAGAVVALGMGLGFYFWKKDVRVDSSTNATLQQVPGGRAYETLAVPEVADEAESWKLPHPVDAEVLWNYDLFTPAEVRWDPLAGKYRAKADTGEIAPFGIKVVSITHPVYRVTLRGDAPLKNEKMSVLLEDAEATGKRTSLLQEGGTLNDGKIIVKTIDLQEKTNADGTLTRNLSVVLYDKDLNRTIRLTPGQPYAFKETVSVTIAATDGSAKQWVLSQIGEQIKDPELGTFTLKGIDFDTRTVNFEKLYKPSPHKPEQVESATLAVESPLATASTSEQAP